MVPAGSLLMAMQSVARSALEGTAARNVFAGAWVADVSFGSADVYKE